MRRLRQELPKEECEKILIKATAGVLSVLGDGGYPYGVSYFRSVIAFGRIHRLESMEELIHGLRLLGEKYNPGDHAGLQHEIGKSVAMPGGISHTRVAVLCMEIDHLSGKEAIELVRAHK